MDRRWMENFRKYDWNSKEERSVKVGRVGRTIASLRLTTPIDLTRNYCSNHTRDSCLLFIYRLRCIFDAAWPNNRRANIRHTTGDRIFPRVMRPVVVSSTVRNSSTLAFPLPGQNLSEFSLFFRGCDCPNLWYKSFGEKLGLSLPFHAFLQIRERISIETGIG